MARKAQTQSRWYPPLEEWPPDDTEESILGLEVHQKTITIVRWGANEAADLAREPWAPVPWSATSQLVFLGRMRPDGSPYRTLPDVLVFPHPIDPLQGRCLQVITGEAFA